MYRLRGGDRPTHRPILGMGELGYVSSRTFALFTLWEYQGKSDPDAVKAHTNGACSPASGSLGDALRPSKFNKVIALVSALGPADGRIPHDPSRLAKSACADSLTNVRTS